MENRKDACRVEKDPSSYANLKYYQTQHCHLELKVNFDNHTLRGFVLLTIYAPYGSAEKLCLDCKFIDIFKVEIGNKTVEYDVSEENSVLGSRLSITLPAGLSSFEVKIYYSTTSACAATDWLQPEQTSGKKYPFMYTQCQAILARTLLPCQDTPAIKMTYTAKISIPKKLVALMSAVKLDTVPDPTDSQFAINSFEQKVPIPSYLLVVVVGALENRVIGPRSKVWAEKELVEAAAYEFSETEQMLQIAEGLLGPYVWGVYDLLVLPPSFSFGGMENPCLTFVTPTLLAGDRSLVLTIAHEISHSWTGNLVTNATYEHYWLNEGYTVFVERKIAGRMKGEKFRHFEAYSGWETLKETVFEEYGEGNQFNALVPNLTGLDPDDAWSRIPYEKGSAFLMYIEEVLGGPEVFEPFLRAYIEKFKYKSITTEDWKSYLFQFFPEKQHILDKINWLEWLYGRNMPPNKPSFDTALADSIITLSAKWLGCKDDETTQFSASDIKGMHARVLRHFLQLLLEKSQLTAKKLDVLDNIYKISSFKNAEIKFRWLRLCLKGRRPNSIADSLKFLNSVGRLAYHKPLCRDLCSWPEAREAAIDNYHENKRFLCAITRKAVEKGLGLNSGTKL